MTDSMRDHKYHPETIAVHAGYTPDEATGALTPPIQLATTFERDADGDYPRGYHYTRSANPNRTMLEARLAALEGGTVAAAFSSGSAAMLTLLQALDKDAHVVAPQDIYYGIQIIMRDILAPWGLQYTLVDMTDLDAVAGAIQENTRLILIETPSNPMMKITDIAAIADLAHANGAHLACDNTIPSPLFQQPLSLGADIVVHATTKYLNGHSDVIGGALVGAADDDYFQRIRQIQTVGGAIPSPYDCWLTLRGLATLPYRMRAIAEHTLQVALFLDDHPRIAQVLHPMLPSHPQNDLARQQMTAHSGLFSVLVAGDEADAMRVAANVQLFTRATSFGGMHSSIEHRASMEDETSTTPRNLLRISIGLEHPDDLIADLAQALNE